MEKLPISLVVITLNEEKNIERCLKSVPWAADVVVLDSGSQDATITKAKNLGARTFVESFRGFREQKQRATDLAQYDWVISLDADEALSPGLSEKIQNLVKLQMDGASGFEVPRISYHLGRWISHGGWYPDYQLRFFNRKTCKWVGGHIHEKVTGENIKRLSSPIQHWVFSTLAEQVDTNNEYSTKGAADLFEKGTKFSVIKLFTKPVFKFLETYIWKMGFRDGLPGFIISVGAAYSIFLKYAKLWELTREKKK